jgi:hypothetical protein
MGNGTPRATRGGEDLMSWDSANLERHAPAMTLRAEWYFQVGCRIYYDLRKNCHIFHHTCVGSIKGLVPEAPERVGEIWVGCRRPPTKFRFPGEPVAPCAPPRCNATDAIQLHLQPPSHTAVAMAPTDLIRPELRFVVFHAVVVGGESPILIR